MNELYTKEFIKVAMQNGVPQEKIAVLLQRAEEISKRQVKTASTEKVDIVDDLIKSAGMEKNASSVSYVHGLMNEALRNGANIPQTIAFTKKALDATVKKLSFMEKVSYIANNPQLNLYAEGFIGTAKQAGLSQDEAISLLVDVVDREKQAAGEEMFKQPQAPEADPAAGAPPGMEDAPPGMEGGAPGAQGPDAEEAQIMQMFESLPPEEQQQIIQQLLAVISGGQGGPGGPVGAGGPPTGIENPPMAPQGGPQGPA